MVSIPAGFSDALRHDPTSISVVRRWVSIPAGFSDALRHILSSPFCPKTPVSIPAGFSDALRRGDAGCDDRTALNVSIPAGFSDALRHGSTESELVYQRLFQSLLGFLMRCDVAKFGRKGGKYLFQSLLGFLMRCDSIVHLTISYILLFQSLLGFLMRCDAFFFLCHFSHLSVSIPAGFSDALRRISFDVVGLHDMCFNPCWVF